ncbi:MAG TPA: hypothetical protein ENJ27_02175 [Candidatus Moranbacteria bacterium]|nr:hypothetical protein [Candidatus Moranbacteria bacterium]
MKKKRCSCGRIFLIPSNNTEREVLFQRENPLELILAGIDVRIKRKYLFEMCKECASRRCLKIISSVITISDDGSVIVDWGMYKETPRAGYLNSVLDKLGILSGYAEGKWIVMSQTEGCINPMHGRSINLYFTSPDDALAYAKACRVRRGHIMRAEDVIVV